MKRREFIKLSGGFFTTSMLSLSCREKKGNPKNPNVVLIMTDDQGWGDIHSHENPDIDTPVLDRLAVQGAHFERFYVSPVCAPTVTLLAPESRQKGKIKFKGEMGWANDWLTDWTDTESTAWWDINIIKSADYEVTLFYSCPEQDTGSDIVVTVGGKELKSTIDKAHDPAPFDTNDRVKRTEVYEKVWGELNLGRVRLNQGDTRLSVRAVKIPGSRVMDLKAVQINKRIN